METIFKKKDFTLCDVQVPDGYPQSQTHVGVAKHNGYVYLTCSPYPAEKIGFWEIHIRRLYHLFTGHILKSSIDCDEYENPLIYKAYEVDDSPSKFKMLKPAPLMERPEFQTSMLSSYNSDPELFIEGEKVYVLNRSYIRFLDEKGERKKKIVVSMIKGNTESDFTLEKIESFLESNSELISPCIEKCQSGYIGTFLETASALDGETFKGLYLSTSDTIEGLKNLQSYKEVLVDTSKYLPWHMSLFTYSGKLYTIITCVKKGSKEKLYQLLGEFNDDLSSLSIYQTPLTDYNSYRGAAYVTEDGEFVLYSTTLHEKVKGSKSVDGRDIIMAKMDFLKLINDLK